MKMTFRRLATMAGKKESHPRPVLTTRRRW